MANVAITPLSKLDMEKALVLASRNLEDAKRRLDLAQLNAAEADAEYIRIALLAKAHGVKVSGVEFDATNGIPMQSSFVDGTNKNSTLDEGQFAKLIGATKWKLVTKTVLDQAKLKAMMAAGKIDPAQVALCTKAGDRKHYARFTSRTASVKRVTKRPMVQATAI